MSSRHLGQYKRTFYVMDEVVTAYLLPPKALVTRMHFQIILFLYHCVFKSIHFCLHIQMFAFS